MHNDKMIQFVKRWKDLQQKQADLDYEKAALARDIRGEFPSGEVGDRQFVGWCGLELGVMPVAAQELLDRARVATTVPDQKQWRRLGGFASLKHVAGLAEADRKDVVVQALGAGCDVKVVLRDRGMLAPSKAPDYKTDAQRLAEYVAGLPNPPKYIRDIAAKYVATKGKRAA